MKHGASYLVAILQTSKEKQQHKISFSQPAQTLDMQYICCHKSNTPA